MERYANRGGDSGVTGYELGEGKITVQFKDGAQYLYNAQSPGSTAVSEMHHLAVAGVGLNSYISRVVRKNFAQKLK